LAQTDCIAAFNTADFQYQNISAMGEPTATQIGEGASGGLAGALISKIQKTQITAILGGYSHAKQLADTRFVRFLNAADTCSIRQQKLSILGAI
jgi:hypothetical protein